jgi:hypothetical protein
VSSLVNEGSSFIVQLPVAVAGVISSEPVEDVVELPEVNFNSFGRRPHILIVEDNDGMRST